jgi:hypothetical protein
MDNAMKAVDPLPRDVNGGFLDFFRCPPEFAPFQLSKELSHKEGFFRFGQAICYGSSAGTVAGTPTQSSFDALSAAKFQQNKVSLDFNPSQVIENLRRERYLAANDTGRFLRSIYYLLRPLLTFPIRKSVQRFVLSRRLKERFPSWPVDFSVEQIFESLMELALHGEAGKEVPFIWFWPEGHTSALMMTHDVEDDLGAANCGMLMDLDDSVGLKSAFQLVPEARYECFEELVANVRARGFEANLHDLSHDGRLYEDPVLFKERAERINQYAEEFHLNGFRAGAMHRNQEWFHLLKFQYEMSVPSVAHLEPQQGGCCSVMPYFVGNLIELPLTTVQDYALFYILKEKSIDLWKQQVETIVAHHGLISFIVHPDYIVESRERGLYRELLQHLAELKNEKNIWWALPNQINVWWRQRAKLKLIKKGNRWEIEGSGEGSGKERARVAYARLENGKLLYRIEERGHLHSRSAKP